MKNAEKIMLKKMYVFLIALISLGLGFLIYFFWRTDTTFFWSWLELAGIQRPDELREYVMIRFNCFPEWVIYSLPNGLWAFSYSLIIVYLWIEADNSLLRFIWLASVPLIGLGYEGLQFLGVIDGTFCYVDLLLCFLGIAGGWSLGKYLRKIKKRGNL